MSGIDDTQLEELRSRLDDVAEELEDIGLAKLKDSSAPLSWTTMLRLLIVATRSVTVAHGGESGTIRVISQLGLF